MVCLPLTSKTAFGVIESSGRTYYATDKIDLSELSTGAYLLKIEVQSGDIIVKQVIKM